VGSGRHTSVTDLGLTDHGVEQARSLDSRLDQNDDRR
jgi:broad specificity phosphatase PhoE